MIDRHKAGDLDTANRLFEFFMDNLITSYHNTEKLDFRLQFLKRLAYAGLFKDKIVNYALWHTSVEEERKNILEQYSLTDIIEEVKRHEKYCVCKKEGDKHKSLEWEMNVMELTAQYMAQKPYYAGIERVNMPDDGLPQYFRPVTDNQETAHYSFYGVAKNDAMLWTDATNIMPDKNKLSFPEVAKPMKCIIQPESDKPYVELHFDDTFALHRPPKEGLTIAGYDIGPVPYIHTYECDGNIAVRVIDSHWIQKFAEDSFARKLNNQYVITLLSNKS